MDLRASPLRGFWRAFFWVHILSEVKEKEELISSATWVFYTGFQENPNTYTLTKSFMRMTCAAKGCISYTYPLGKLATTQTLMVFFFHFFSLSLLVISKLQKPKYKFQRMGMLS